MMMKYVVVALIALLGSTEGYHHISNRRTIMAKENVKIAMSSLLGGIDEMKAALDTLKAAQDEINGDNHLANGTPEAALADAKAKLDAMIAEHDVNNTNKIAQQTADYVGSATPPVLSFRALVQGIDEMKAALETLKDAQATINGDNPSGLNETPEQALADAKAALDAIIAEHELNNDNHVAQQTADYVGSATAPVLEFNRRALVQGIDDMKAALDTLHAAQDEINQDNPSGLNETPEQALADAKAILDAMIAEHDLVNDANIAQQTADYVTSTAFTHVADTFDILESSTYALENNLRRANIL